MIKDRKRFVCSAKFICRCKILRGFVHKFFNFKLIQLKTVMCPWSKSECKQSSSVPKSEFRLRDCWSRKVLHCLTHSIHQPKEFALNSSSADSDCMYQFHWEKDRPLKTFNQRRILLCIGCFDFHSRMRVYLHMVLYNRQQRTTVLSLRRVSCDNILVAYLLYHAVFMHNRVGFQKQSSWFNSDMGWIFWGFKSHAPCVK